MCHIVVKGYTTLQYVGVAENHSGSFNGIEILNQASKYLSFNLSPSDFSSPLVNLLSCMVFGLIWVFS